MTPQTAGIAVRHTMTVSLDPRNAFGAEDGWFEVLDRYERAAG